jgi:ABC-type transport system involved in multi-copper enzyme maturation permease subunit
VELAKAARQKFTYLGPLLVIFAVLVTPLAHPIVKDGQGDYEFVAFATPLALDFLGLLFLIVYCAGLISSELGNGSVRMALVRPLLRHEYLLAKLLVGLTYAVLLTAVGAGASWAVARVLGDLNGVSYAGETLYSSRHMALTYLCGAVMSLAPLFATVAYAVMISTLTRNNGAAIGSAVGIWLLIDAVKHPLRIAPFLFTSYVEAPWQVFTDCCGGLESSWFPAGYYCLGTSAAAFCVFLAVAWYVLNRRDLQG